MSKKKIPIKWSESQNQVAESVLTNRFTNVAKGRRFGLTRFMAEFLIVEAMREGAFYLWGDTINSNIDRYVERYFMPLLRKLPRHLWRWRQQKKELTIGNSRIDFRSADRPENWEGFGYRIIFLNEAGIVLDGDKGRKLYEESVLPMMADYAGSKLVAGGAPKGKNQFYHLCQDARKPENTDSIFLRFTSFDNPFISHETIRLIESKMDPETAQQEIYAKFIDPKSGKFLTVWNEKQHVAPVQAFPGPITLSFDFNVEPMTAVAGQHGQDFLYILREFRANFGEDGLSRDPIEALCKKIRLEWPERFFYVTGDRSGKSRTPTSLKNAYQLIENYLGNCSIEAPNVNPGLQDSRMLCNSVFHTFPTFVDPSCETLIEELSGAIWENGKIKKDRAHHKNDHLDGARYLIQFAMPNYLEWMEG